ncbi:mandelate racemase/muconate lactonizing enzyme family protein [Mesorhizobium sp. CA8]|uniref:mandelate racemase/muconate lactonizing enzyme family protein n=1 Tax=unclassified Mesorhizobium TaxID=325217 RepID=UPI001CCB8375|nr:MULTISPECIES: mandelate racemase/muconate lactonizing enzyme family protein [unclassified Mesorhizobium]MBZ9761694.1 mandelate racemase/muconate lactonizing enzyme family protein [Mesorhizobium sp. CA8]MBZ9820552.1 mandelate racemase/muconate lactonizing enzyme family protein [Mesorhizobium sp. CA4]
MKITRLETVYLPDTSSNTIWVEVHTDEGIVGLGETFYNPLTVTAYIHEVAAPYLIGKDPLRIDRHSRDLAGFLGFNSTGAETRGNSAIDIALWDIFGQVTGQPVWQLLGGLSREQVRIYNTCAGYGGQGFGNRAMNVSAGKGSRRHEDYEASLNNPAELAQDLLSEGITAMKIWPFKQFQTGNLTMELDPAQIKKGLEPLQKIRKAVGEKMEIMLELNNSFNLPTAKRLAHYADEFEPFWYEDPIRADDLMALQSFASATHVPLAASETLATRWSFRDLLACRAAGILLLDLSWCGGISEAKKIAAMAEAHQLPVAAHDCTGPVVLSASLHLSFNAPNALMQEAVRAYYRGWYLDVVSGLPEIVNGYAAAPRAPGLGIKLLPDAKARQGAIVHSTFS